MDAHVWVWFYCYERCNSTMNSEIRLLGIFQLGLLDSIMKPLYGRVHAKHSFKNIGQTYGFDKP